MAIHHASSGELIDIRPLKDNLITTATKTLFKSDHFEVSRMSFWQARACLCTKWRER